MKKVKKVIEGNIEPTEPQDKILAWLKENDGKLLTAPLVEKLKMAVRDNSIRMVKKYGDTRLKWGDKEPGMLLANSETGVRINSAFIEAQNSHSYAALRGRNESRLRVLQDERAMQELETELENYVAAKERLSELLSYGGLFSPDRFALKNSFGIKEDF